MLLSAGRLAFEDGDEKLSLRYHAAAMNLASHLDQAEVAALLPTIVAHQMRQSVRAAVTDHLLPAMSGADHTVRDWRQMLSPVSNQSPPPEKIWISEWHYVTREIVLPGLLLGDFSAFISTLTDPSLQAPVRDADLLLDRYADFVLENAGRLERGEPLVSPEQSVAGRTHLSENARALLDKPVSYTHLRAHET